MPADDAVEIEAGAVMAIGSGMADAPERCGFPLLDDAAVELHLVEILADVVILEIAIDAADRVGTAARDPALALLVLDFVGQIFDLAFEAFGLSF